MRFASLYEVTSTGRAIKMDAPRSDFEAFYAMAYAGQMPQQNQGPRQAVQGGDPGNIINEFQRRDCMVGIGMTDTGNPGNNLNGLHIDQNNPTGFAGRRGGGRGQGPGGFQGPGGMFQGMGPRGGFLAQAYAAKMKKMSMSQDFSGSPLGPGCINGFGPDCMDSGPGGNFSGPMGPGPGPGGMFNGPGPGGMFQGPMGPGGMFRGPGGMFNGPGPGGMFQGPGGRGPGGMFQGPGGMMGGVGETQGLEQARGTNCGLGVRQIDVMIQNKSGQFQTIRGLIDSGAGAVIMDPQVAQMLGFGRQDAVRTIQGQGEQARSNNIPLINIMAIIPPNMNPLPLQAGIFADGQDGVFTPIPTCDLVKRVTIDIDNGGHTLTSLADGMTMRYDCSGGQGRMMGGMGQGRMGMGRGGR